MLPSFSAGRVWAELTRPPNRPGPNLFMAVPTIYAKLAEHHSAAGLSQEVRRGCGSRTGNPCYSGEPGPVCG